MYIELKLALSDRLKSLREKKAITQVEMAKLISSSQSRVAKMESGD
ncbi:MAG: helix-turn-helix domain-containing protein, partial [Steroidobacteraceae bacterium]